MARVYVKLATLVTSVLTPALRAPLALVVRACVRAVLLELRLATMLLETAAAMLTTLATSVMSSVRTTLNLDNSLPLCRGFHWNGYIMTNISV